MNVKEKTRLIIACENDNLELVEAIIENELYTINYIFNNDNDYIQIYKKIKKQEVDEIYKNEKVKCSINNMYSVNGYKWEKYDMIQPNTALSYSCYNNNLKMMKLLIKRGANINDISIFIAVKNNNIETLKLLINEGAYINKMIIYNMVFRYCLYLIIGSYLKIEYTLFDYACQLNNDDVVIFLIKSGIDIFDKSKCMDIVVKNNNIKLYKLISHLHNKTNEHNDIFYELFDSIIIYKQDIYWNF